MRGRGKSPAIGVFIIVTAFLMIGLCIFGGPSVYAASANDPVVELKLNKLQPEDNERFNVENMLPGDLIAQNYRLTVSHNVPIKVYFDVKIKSETKSMSKALKLRITERASGNVLYDGYISGTKGKTYAVSLGGGHDEDILEYCIEAYMDTSVGNEYQEATLRADFRWYAEKKDLSPGSETSDSFNLALGVGLLAMSASVFVILLIVRRRRRNSNDGQE